MCYNVDIREAYNMTKGERIQEQRKKIGMAQNELAAKIDVSKQNMYKYENDIVTNIPSDKIELIASVLNVSPAYIMGWTDNATTEKKKKPIDNNIKKYFKLNSIGKNKVGTYIDDLLCNPQYMVEDYTYEIAAYDIDDTPVDEWQPPKTETTAD